MIAALASGRDPGAGSRCSLEARNLFEIGAESFADGVFVADMESLDRVDDFLRRSAIIREWVGARLDVWWRHKAAFNIALASAGAVAPLDASYNVQLHVHTAEQDGTGGVRSRGSRASVLHFNGAGRRFHSEWKQRLLG